MATVNSILADITTLSSEEKDVLKEFLTDLFRIHDGSLESVAANERFSGGLVCPICGCINIVRNGRRKDGTQRYICHDCGKSFVATSNSIVSSTKKELSVWEKYIDCMMHGFSLRKTASICSIHRNTAFSWRHKILGAL